MYRPSEKAIKLANVYLYNVLADVESEDVVNRYGLKWTPFKPIMNLVEKAAGIDEKESPGWRTEVWIQVAHHRLDLFYQRMGDILELLIETQYPEVSQYVGLFNESNIHPLGQSYVRNGRENCC